MNDNNINIQLQNLVSLVSLVSLQNLVSLGSLEQLEQLEHKITFTCKNYWEFDFCRIVLFIATHHTLERQGITM
jgi:hypothetical protein